MKKIRGHVEERENEKRGCAVKMGISLEETRDGRAKVTCSQVTMTRQGPMR